MSTPAEVINASFFNAINTEEGREKTAEYSGNYIRDRLREVSFLRKLIPPLPVTRAELQRSVNHDTMVRIVDIEPNSKAMALSFRGQPTARMIRGARYEIPFWTISSEVFEKTEQELMAYEMPITKIIEENSVKDMQAIEDRYGLVYIEACVQAMQLAANGGVATAMKASLVRAGTVKSSSVVKGDGAISSATDDFVVYPALKPDFIKVRQLLHRRHMRAEVGLITEPDFDNLLGWTYQDVGQNIVGETATVGWKANGAVGLRLIRTIKVDILREGNIYVFPAPEFFGRFYILNNTKFYIDKVRNVISWSAWEDIGIGFGNVAAPVKLELFSGSVTPGATTAGYADLIPKEDEELFPVNNRVDQGDRAPVVNQY